MYPRPQSPCVSPRASRSRAPQRPPIPHGQVLAFFCFRDARRPLARRRLRSLLLLLSSSASSRFNRSTSRGISISGSQPNKVRGAPATPCRSAAAAFSMSSHSNAVRPCCPPPPKATTASSSTSASRPPVSRRIRSITCALSSAGPTSDRDADASFRRRVAASCSEAATSWEEPWPLLLEGGSNCGERT